MFLISLTIITDMHHPYSHHMYAYTLCTAVTASVDSKLSKSFPAALADLSPTQCPSYLGDNVVT